MVTLVDGTRQAIVALLQQSPVSTIEELAQELGMAAASVRRHLDILQRDRLVAYQVVRNKPGRPQHAYYLTEEGMEALPKRYQYLLHWVLEALGSLEFAQAGAHAGGSVEEILSGIADRIVEPYQERLQGEPLAERVAVLQELLSEHQFAPAMEEEGGAVRAHLMNCPFRSIAMENPVVCVLDQRITSLVLGVEATDEERINRSHHHCIYLAQP